MVDRIVEKVTGMKGMVTRIEMGIGQGKVLTRSYGRDRSSSNDRSRPGSRASTNRANFARDCPTSREERDLEQLQHMLNMEEQDHRSLSTPSSDEDYRSPLNL